MPPVSMEQRTTERGAGGSRQEGDQWLGKATPRQEGVTMERLML